MQNFKKLKIWRKGHKLVLAVYRLTKGFPLEERFGLTSQLRRACTSIPANIAEGCGRGSDADFARHLQISMGSASESEYCLLLAHELGYLSQTDYEKLDDEIAQIKQMLTALMRKLRAENGKC